MFCLSGLARPAKPQTDFAETAAISLIEKVRRIQRIVPQKFEKCSVQLIGPDCVTMITCPPGFFPNSAP